MVWVEGLCICEETRPGSYGQVDRPMAGAPSQAGKWSQPGWGHISQGLRSGGRLSLTSWVQLQELGAKVGARKTLGEKVLLGQKGLGTLSSELGQVQIRFLEPS